MSLNYSKIQSVQGTPYNTNHRLLDFKIPEGVYDLSKSHINFNISQDATDVDGDTSVIYDTNVAISDSGEDGAILKNFCLVRNVDLYSQKMGMVESIRDVNLLRNTLKTYTTDENTKIEDRYRETNSTKEIRALNESTTRLLKTNGNSAVIGRSENVDHDLQIPLEDLLGIGSQMVNTQRMGQLNLHLEVNWDKLHSSQGRTAGAAIFSNDAYVKSMVDDEVNATGGNISLGDVVPLTTSGFYDDSSESPWFLGQKVLVSGRNASTAAGEPAARAAGGLVSTRHTIVRIENNDNGSLSLYTNTPVANVPNGNTFYAPFQPGTTDARGSLDGVNAASHSITVNGCELVLAEMNSSQAVPEQNSFITWSTEADNGNGVTSFTKQYSVEPEADALMVCYPVADLSCRSLLAYNRYRTMVDQEFTTNRDVFRKRPLDFDQIKKWFIHCDLPLKSLLLKQKNSAEEDNANVSFDINAIFQKMSVTDKFKQFQVHTSTIAVNDIRLFKRLPKMM